MVTFKQLETLFWVARLRTFQSAADRLCTTQSAISKRLQELESTMGFPLFDRQQRLLRLTTKGEELLRLAEEALEVNDRINALQGTAPVLARRFRFGVTELAALTWLPTAINIMQNKFPGVSVEGEVGMNRYIHSALRQGNLDLVVSHQGVPEVPFVVRAGSSVRFELMGSPELLKSQQFQTFDQVLGFVLIHLGTNSWTGSALNSWLHSEGIFFPRTMVSNSLTTAIRLTLSGAGVCYLPYDCLATLVDSGKLEVIKLGPRIPSAHYSIMYRGGAESSINVEMADIIEEVCDFSQKITLSL